ncbi:DinB family protein [Fulvivirgaceae bacterium PWU5]|uniref:DinB family protein n=1 Tax=Dawidia cretensis TaxID=2782350 RepID=A0AAP2DWV3_9BACT|nr:DinB family protein [Dawidia cretensis]MBT1708871.1 DinB family protein [Dawidia cretensis]
MNPVDKNHWLDGLEASVERHLQHAIYYFQNQDSEVLLKPSVTGGWSIAQCLEHLNRYGHFYLPAIDRALQRHDGQPDAPTFTSTWLGSYFTRMMQPETGKWKIKAMKAYAPPPNLDAHAIVAEFIHQQETLLALLSRARRADLTATRVPISIATFIRLRLGDVFAFLIAHDERHIQQALRNLPVSQDIDVQAVR